MSDKLTFTRNGDGTFCIVHDAQPREYSETLNVGKDGAMRALHDWLAPSPTCPHCGQTVREGSRHGEIHDGPDSQHVICVSEVFVEPASATETENG